MPTKRKIPPLKVIKITIICIKRSKPPSHLLQSSSSCTNPYLSLQPHHLLPSGPLFQLPLHLHFLHTTHVYPFHPSLLSIFHLFNHSISIMPQVHHYSEALPTQPGYSAGVSRQSATGNCE